MENKHRAIVVGCGRIGAQSELDERRDKPATHLGVYRRCKYTELVGLVDTDKEKLAAAKSQIDDNIATFNDVVTAIDKLRPDIVSVATTSSSHKDVVKAAAAKKTPLIMCEKPIAETIEDAEEMVAACNESGSILIVNHTRRFDRFLGAWRKSICEEGIVGEFQQIWGGYAIGLQHMGTHLIDFMMFLLGNVKSVMGVFNHKAHTAIPGDTCVDGILEFENDTHGAIQSVNVKNYSLFEIRLLGAKMDVFIRDMGLTVEHVPAEPSQRFSGFTELNIAHRGSAHRPETGESQFGAFVDHVVAVLNGTEFPTSTGEDALGVLKVLSALKKSAQNEGAKTIV